MLKSCGNKLWELVGNLVGTKSNGTDLRNKRALSREKEGVKACFYKNKQRRTEQEAREKTLRDPVSHSDADAY